MVFKPIGVTQSDRLRLPIKPNLFIIGAVKSGTTFLGTY
jgi:hypothetical protein